MKCEGKYVFKSIKTRDGGEFTNDKGQKVKYKPSYIVSVDDIQGADILARQFKFSEDNNELASKFKNINPYEDIIISFDVEIYNNNVRLVPTDVICENEN